MGPFVGRGLELGVLRSEFGRAAAGDPRCVLMEGEAGIGKSSLLTRFCDELEGACVLRAGGEEGERLLAYGVAAQLLGGELPDGSRDPLAVGMELLSVIDRAQGRDGVVVVVVDDLHWADERSAAALLFGLRRLVADRVLAVVSARLGELGAAGEGWERFVAGDSRATRVRLGGLTAADVCALAELLELGPLPMRVAMQFREHTGGNPLYCRALLEELGPDRQRRERGVLPAPRAFGSVILSRVAGLSEPAQRLVTAAAVLGERCALRNAAELAELEESAGPLEEAAAAGLLGEEGVGAGSEVVFVHPLMRAAIYHDLGPARRRWHREAAGIVAGAAALPHRVAAATGVDDALAGDLEVAAVTARGRGQMAKAALWLEQAAELSSSSAEGERLLLDALDLLVSGADVGRAMALVERIGDLPDSARRGALVGELDLLAGRGDRLEARMEEIWETHDPAHERAVAARAAMTLAIYLNVAARKSDSLAWSDRALDAAAGDPIVERICRPQRALCDVWLRGRAGLGWFDQLPSDPSAVPLELTDALWMRAIAKTICGEHLVAVDDTRTVAARVSDGAPVGHPSQCLGIMADAEYRLGRWDDAVVHGELAVSLSRDADRAWDYPFVHCMATYVPAARGDWDVAAAHVDASRDAAAAFPVPTAVWAATSARVALGDARGDHQDVVDAAATVRRAGVADPDARPGITDWREPELDALITLGRADEAARALDELETAAGRFDLPSAKVRAAGLRGRLEAARGDQALADAAFADAWTKAEGLELPFLIAWLGLADGTRLRAAGRRREAIERLQPARDVLAGLGARPYLERCEEALRACGVQSEVDGADPLGELTQSELAVGRLVAAGHSNKEVASELFVSVKTIEFHLRHVFQKLGIRSRVALAARLHGDGRQD